MNKLSKEEQQALRKKIISEIEFEVRSLLYVGFFEPGRNKLTSLAEESKDDDIVGWFNGETFDELAKIAQNDPHAYELACKLATQSVVNEGSGIPKHIKMFILTELLKLDGGPPRKRGSKPTVDKYLSSKIVRLARRVAKQHMITFYPNEANIHEFTACHIVAEVLTKVYAGGREQRVLEKHRRFRASWIKEMSKSM